MQNPGFNNVAGDQVFSMGATVTICIHIPSNLPYVLLLQVRALSSFSRLSDLCVSCCLEASRQIIVSEAVTQRNDKTGFFSCDIVLLLGYLVVTFRLSSIELNMTKTIMDGQWLLYRRTPSCIWSSGMETERNILEASVIVMFNLLAPEFYI
jgi:hypothetical protein